MLAQKLLNKSTGSPEFIDWTLWDTTNDGTEVSSGYAITDDAILLALSNTSFLAIWRYQKTLRWQIISVSGTVPSYGTINVWNLNSGSSGNAMVGLSATVLDSGRVLLVYADDYDVITYGIILSISGTTVTSGAIATLIPTGNAHNANVVCVDVDKAVLSYNASGVSQACIVTASGTTIDTPGAAFTWYADAADKISQAVLNASTVIVSYNAPGDSEIDAVILTIGSSTITKPGSAVKISGAATVLGGSAIIAISSAKAIAFFAASTFNSIYAVLLDISSSTITARAIQQVYNDATNGQTTYISAHGCGAVRLGSRQGALAFRGHNGAFISVVDIALDDTTIYNTRNIMATSSGFPIGASGAGLCLVDAGRMLASYGVPTTSLLSKVLKK